MVDKPARVTQHLKPRAWTQACRPSLLPGETEGQAAEGRGRDRVDPSGARKDWEWQRGWSRGGAPGPCTAVPAHKVARSIRLRSQEPSLCSKPPPQARRRGGLHLGSGLCRLPGAWLSPAKSQGSYPDPLFYRKHPLPKATSRDKPSHLAFIPTLPSLRCSFVII